MFVAGAIAPAVAYSGRILEQLDKEGRGDLHLVRPLTPSELKGFGKEETRRSESDLHALEQRHARLVAAEDRPGFPWTRWLPSSFYDTDKERPRQHGLLSKAQRVLDIAGWSIAAQKDVEIYRLVDCDGLTPLLALFNEATLVKGAEAIEAVRKEQELIEAERRLRIADQR